MKLALFSDVHGNMSALEAVMEAIEPHGPFDAVVCAGDLVYLGPSPDEVVQHLQASGVQAVRGNCEDYVTGRRPITDVPSEHRSLHEAHIAWNRNRLSDDRLQYLHQLPLTLTFEPAPNHKLLVCHATPSDSEPDYALMQRLDSDELLRAYERPGTRTVAFGHWHEPRIVALGGLTLLNVSSVSIPFDRKPQASYTIAEWRNGLWSFQQYRTSYDLSPEIARIHERAMPRPPWPKVARS